jgi:hypothetical protein
LLGAARYQLTSFRRMNFNAYRQTGIAIKFNPIPRAFFHPDLRKPVVPVREHFPLGGITPMKFSAGKHGDCAPLSNNASPAPIKVIPARPNAAFVLLESTNTYEVRHFVLGSYCCLHTNGKRITPRITRPPAPWQEHDRGRVAGRVHAVVRLRPPLAHLTSSRPSVATNDLRHALRHQLAPRLGRPSWPVTLESECFATRRGRAFHQQNSSARPSNLTLIRRTTSRQQRRQMGRLIRPQSFKNPGLRHGQGV